MRPSVEAAWSKAAACDAHAKHSTDENLRARFERLRDSWIRIANDAEIVAAAQIGADRQKQLQRGAA